MITFMLWLLCLILIIWLKSFKAYCLVAHMLKNANKQIKNIIKYENQDQWKCISTLRTCRSPM